MHVKKQTSRIVDSFVRWSKVKVKKILVFLSHKIPSGRNIATRISFTAPPLPSLVKSVFPFDHTHTQTRYLGKKIFEYVAESSRILVYLQ